MTGTISDIKDFMFTVSADGKDYAFTFEADKNRKVSPKSRTAIKLL